MQVHTYTGVWSSIRPDGNTVRPVSHLASNYPSKSNTRHTYASDRTRSRFGLKSALTRKMWGQATRCQGQMDISSYLPTYPYTFLPLSIKVGDISSHHVSRTSCHWLRHACSSVRATSEMARETTHMFVYFGWFQKCHREGTRAKYRSTYQQLCPDLDGLFCKELDVRTVRYARVDRYY
jgi:hypothetical protein